MSSRTRYFLIGSALIVVTGLCTGLVAYYNGTLTTSASSRLPELSYLPADASAVAYADVKDIMASEFRQRLRELLPTGAAKDQLLAETGIDIEHDIDSVLAGLGSTAEPRGAIVIMRGRFDVARIEALAAQHGATIEDYNGRRLLLAPHPVEASDRPVPPTVTAMPGIAFLEPGLLALGTRDELRKAVDSSMGAGGMVGNDALMGYVLSAQQSGNAWVVGHADHMLAGQPGIPSQFLEQLPALDWFVVSADVDRTVRAVIRADARDEQAAEQLRNVVNGGVAAARLMSGRDPRFDAVLNTMQTAGTGRQVELSFAFDPELLDLMRQSKPAQGAAPRP